MEIDQTRPAPLALDARAAQIMEVAQSLEAQFLSEMLKSAGVGETPTEFGGGSGEDQFASFLRDEQAKQMTLAGGIGLAQSLFDAMMEAPNE
jgi:Rod binding domain-containing protein